MNIQKMCVMVVVGALLCVFNASTGDASATERRELFDASLVERWYIETNLPTNYVPGSLEFASERISVPEGMSNESGGQELGTTGGIVPYYYRYLIYDTNEGDYDYIYVFRLPIQYTPS